MIRKKLLIGTFMSENNTNTTSVSRTPSYTIYKPNGQGNGGAVSFAFNRSKGAVFVEAASQSGDKQFAWQDKIIMKWGLSDLGSILAGLQGKQPQVKLFHQNDRGNSACSLVSRQDAAQAPFLFSISRQTTENRQVQKVAITFSDAEAVILENALRIAVSRLLAW